MQLFPALLSRFLRFCRFTGQLHVFDQQHAAVQKDGCLPRQGFESRNLLLGQGARLLVDDANRAERVPARRNDRRARVEPDLRVAYDKGVELESRVLTSIWDDKDLPGFERVRAEAGLARGFSRAQAFFRLEPLPVAGHKGNQRDRDAADGRGHLGQIVEALLRGGVEDLVAFERREASGFQCGACRHESYSAIRNLAADQRQFCLSRP